MAMHDRYVGKILELFTIDFTDVGGGILYLTNNTSLNSISWGGTVYAPNPIQVSDLSNNVQSAAPSVVIDASNLTGIFTHSIALTRDLVGGVITRNVVNRANLDDGDDPSTTPVQPPDIYRIENSARTRTSVSLQCTSQLATWGSELPSKRMLIRDYPGLSRVN